MIGIWTHAARRLCRSPGFSLTTILSLALALGAAAVSVIGAVRFRALPFRDGNRLTLPSPQTTIGSESNW